MTEEYQAQTAAVAATAVTQAALVYAALQAGTVTGAEAVGLIAATVNAANAAAGGLADLYVAGQVEAVTGVPTPTIGIVPVDDTERLTAAVETVLDKLPEPEMEHDATPIEPEGVAVKQKPEIPAALERLARAEPLAAAQETAVEAMDVQPKVIGWRRQLDAEPCELCRWWYADGRIYRTTTKFQQHPNCNCQPEPVIEGATA